MNIDTWIEEYQSLQDKEARRREQDKLASWVYPRLLWGGWDNDGPITALKQADYMLRAIGR